MILYDRSDSICSNINGKAKELVLQDGKFRKGVVNFRLPGASLGWSQMIMINLMIYNFDQCTTDGHYVPTLFFVISNNRKRGSGLWGR